MVGALLKIWMREIALADRVSLHVSKGDNNFVSKFMFFYFPWEI